MPFGITGCIQRNGIGVSGGIVLSQASSQDQPQNTDSDGCFVFSGFTPGVSIAVEFNEAGVNSKPFIQLNESNSNGIYEATAAILTQNQTPYNESNFDFVATDSEDGNLHDAVTASPNIIDNPNLIDISVINETGYTIEYNLIDSNGNHADPVYRKVYVLPPDVSPPTLTLNGSSSMTIEQDINNPNLYIEAGAKAIDDRDGDISENISISGNVNSSIAGTYTISYEVSDAAGNTSSANRTIEVKDTAAPVITLLGDNPLVVQKGDSYNEPGASAYDDIEGTVTLTSSNISGTVNSDSVGSYSLNYSYTDNGGNTGIASRTVNVIDTGAPTITLRGSSTVDHELGSPYIDAGASAIDDTGEVISADVPYTGSVDVNTLGTYVLSYNISDASNNAAPTVTRSVQVTQASDATPPVIVLLGSTTVTIAQNANYTDPGVSLSDNVDNLATLTNNLSVINNVDTSVLGSYSVIYDTFDSAGNNAVTVTRTVNVTATPDTTPPAITLIGSNNITVEQGSTYSDQGALATDNIDNTSEITSRIIMSGSVNTSSIGIYTLNYDVFDNSGNAAPTVSRTVQVVAAADTTAPTISLAGNNPINLIVGTPYTEPGYSANDNIDGNITDQVSANASTVNTNAIGSYSVTYKVSDNAGNSTTEIRVVNVSAAPDTTAPIISLLGDNPQEITLGGNYVEQGASATDNVDTISDGDISIDSSAVNTNSIGSYDVSYNVSDSAGNNATTVTRTVNVVSATSSYSASPALAVGASSVSTTLSVADNKQIADINVLIDMPHDWPGDISIILISPSGTSVTIVDRPGYSGSGWGCDTDGFNTTLDDEGSGNVENACPPTGTLIPNNPLSAFDGESSQGIWTLQIDDAYTSADSGTLNSWSLIITQ